MSTKATVRTTTTGNPIAIRADGTDYVATGHPQIWIDRTPWWEQPTTTPTLERERWTVPSIDNTGRAITLELTHDRDKGRWELLNVQ
jgi:hypothetical protein